MLKISNAILYYETWSRGFFKVVHNASRTQKYDRPCTSAVTCFRSEGILLVLRVSILFIRSARGVFSIARAQVGIMNETGRRNLLGW